MQARYQGATTENNDVRIEKVLTQLLGSKIPGGTDIIDKYPFIQGPWSIFKLSSTAETIAVTGDHSVKWVKGNTS